MTVNGYFREHVFSKSRMISRLHRSNVSSSTLAFGGYFECTKKLIFQVPLKLYKFLQFLSCNVFSRSRTWSRPIPLLQKVSKNPSLGLDLEKKIKVSDQSWSRKKLESPISLGPKKFVLNDSPDLADANLRSCPLSCTTVSGNISFMCIFSGHNSIVIAVADSSLARHLVYFRTSMCLILSVVKYFKCMCTESYFFLVILL